MDGKFIKEEIRQLIFDYAEELEKRCEGWEPLPPNEEFINRITGLY